MQAVEYAEPQQLVHAISAWLIAYSDNKYQMSWFMSD